jgi:hypothetical protein
VETDRLVDAPGGSVGVSFENAHVGLSRALTGVKSMRPGTSRTLKDRILNDRMANGRWENACGFAIYHFPFPFRTAFSPVW